MGFDACIDYKAGNLTEELKQACPDGIDIYFENVGGDVTRAVAPLLNMGARVPICGYVSNYNDEDITQSETPFHILKKLDEVPVMFIDCDDEKAVRILLADNKTSDLGGYNDEQLLDLLTNVSEAGELDGTGWNSEDVDKLLKMFNDLPELNTDPVDLQLNYSVLVSCDNDQHQRETLETLTSQGFQVSASML